MLSIRNSAIGNMLSGLAASVGRLVHGTVDAPPIKAKRKPRQTSTDRFIGAAAEHEYERTHGFSGAKLMRRAIKGTVGRAALK